MKRWKTVNKLKVKSEKLKVNKVIKLLLKNRGLKTKKEIGEFLNPKLENVTIENVGIDKKQLKKAIDRIQKSIKNKEKIVVFGDYDVDGICGTAILWETLNSLGAKAMPYIPHRIEEGYGLSIKGIQNVILSTFDKLSVNSAKNLDPSATPQDDKTGLIITVDNGIVANKAVDFANKQGIDVIITDHHVPSKKLPDAVAIVHTTKLCGAGVAYILAQEVENRKLKMENSNGKWKMENGKYLELVALATIADLVPLIGANRTLVKLGLAQLRQTKRIGLLELFKEAGLDQLTIGVYEVGHIIAPRLNAMGRLEYAMDSLRLLCTRNTERAKMLAQKLGTTNKERQLLTTETVLHAKSLIESLGSKITYSSSDPAKQESREVLLEESSLQDGYQMVTRQARTITLKTDIKLPNLLFISHESYQQGVIGLVAGKLVEEFYRPTIVVSVGEKYSKASARSINGFNIIEFIRSSSELLVDAGGHPMAAGFTVETEKLMLLQKTLEDKAKELLDEEKLTRTLRIDCELPLSAIDSKLYQEIQKLVPFGMGNPEPTFVTKGVTIEDMRLVGAERKHIKFVFSCHPEASAEGSQEILRSAQNDKRRIDGIAFGMGERANKLHIGDKVDVAYTIDEDTWNGNERLQLKVKDMKHNKQNS
jgi:single-stranded-DNA-specific exonuclease